MGADRVDSAIDVSTAQFAMAARVELIDPDFNLVDEYSDLGQCYLHVRSSLSGDLADSVCWATAKRMLVRLEEHVARERLCAPRPVSPAKPFDEWLADTTALLEDCVKRGQ